MMRQLVSSAELIRLVNERISKIPSTGSTTLGGVLRLDKPDDDGCNWVASRIKGDYTVGFRQAVTEIRAKYNLEDDS